MENSNSFRDLWAHNKRGNIHITLSLSHQDQCRSDEYFHYSFFVSIGLQCQATAVRQGEEIEEYLAIKHGTEGMRLF